MSQGYSRAISRHYAAYRPPLHQIILAKLLPEQPSFKQGLDIGCGTGVSTHALAPWCQHTLGIDPSDAMIAQAKPTADISYQVADGVSSGIADNWADVVTFAGSLFYAKSDALVKEVMRICQPQACILVYDFEVKLAQTLQGFNIMQAPSEGGYDHQINFTDTAGFATVQDCHESVSLAVTHQQLAHVLLASQSRYTLFADMFKQTDPFQSVVQYLSKVNAQQSLTADIFYSRFTLI